MVCVAGAEHFVESILPLYLYVDFRDQTQVTSLAKQVPLPAGPSQAPESF